jgi:hypothetical protein
MRQWSSGAFGLLALAGVLASGGASAQDASSLPNLRGRWTAQAEAVVAGTAPHHEGSSPLQQPRLITTPVTVTFEAQDGRRFWGNFATAQARTPFVGVIGFDGKTIRIQSSTGMAEARLVDQDTIEAVYSHSVEHSIVAHTTVLKREK